MTLSENVLFYIIVPIYQAERFIENCIKSVISQTYTNWCLILVNDGSTDSSLEICERYAEQDNRIVTIHQNNTGQIAARMTGNRYVIKHANAPSYVIYVDSDDSIESNALQVLNDVISTNHSDMVIYKWRRSEGGRKIFDKAWENKFIGVVYDKRLLYKIVLESPIYNSLCIKAISTHLLADIDYTAYYHIRHGEDLLQSLHYYKASKSVTFINNTLYNYTVNQDSVTQSVCYDNYVFDTSIRLMVLDFIKNEGVWTEKDFQEYYNRMQGLIIKEIVKVANFETEKKNKIMILYRMRDDKYYNIVLSFPHKSIMLYLFKNKMFGLLVDLINLLSGLAAFVRGKFRMKKKISH